MTQAEQIRDHLLRCYIAPARRKGQTFITITAGDVHKELGLRNRVPSICQVMESRLLEREGGVKVSSKQGPPSGRGTTFTITYAVEKNSGETKKSSKLKPVATQSHSSRYTPEAIAAFYALHGAGKETYAALGGGEAFLRKERASFYGSIKRKRMS